MCYTHDVDLDVHVPGQQYSRQVSKYDIHLVFKSYLSLPSFLFKIHHVVADIFILWRCFLSSVHVCCSVNGQIGQRNDHLLCKFHCTLTTFLLGNCHVFTVIWSLWLCSLSTVHSWFTVGKAIVQSAGHMSWRYNFTAASCCLGNCNVFSDVWVLWHCAFFASIYNHVEQGYAFSLMETSNVLVNILLFES